MSSVSVKRLIVVLGDQLNLDSVALRDVDREQDLVWMAEVHGESTRVWSNRVRTTLFLSAMRHFRDELRKKRFRVEYVQLNDQDNTGELLTEIERAVEKLEPEQLVLVEPGEWWLRNGIRELAGNREIDLEMCEDEHFMCTAEEFAEHAEGRKQLRMEYFYREMRKRYDVLIESGEPAGGKWNYDAKNRGKFGKSGPGKLPKPKSFRPSKVTREVIELVEQEFPDNPGDLTDFDWPVTRKQAQAALDDFVENRLELFGEYQDAMWTDEPYLYHSRISAAMNLKLLDPREVIEAAVVAYRADAAPLNAVEGFVRQILGWREYVRGIYWKFMPEYLERNELEASQPLPDFYWTADTDMHCLQQAIGQTLQYGYAHHIQRLMVTGLFALLLGVEPQQVHQWYLAVYVDAVEWVELPNTLGMSQYGDGGVMASKPYVASGNYINRMSNYCHSCRFDPGEAIGDNACPFTTLYWDFLQRHRKALSNNPRMTMQLKNLERKSDSDLKQIAKQAAQLRKSLA